MRDSADKLTQIEGKFNYLLADKQQKLQADTGERTMRDPSRSRPPQSLMQLQGWLEELTVWQLSSWHVGACSSDLPMLIPDEIAYKSHRYVVGQEG